MDDSAAREREIEDAMDVAAIVRGDAAALESLYDRYASLVLAAAQAVVRSREIAEEVVQDVFLTLWRQADRFDPRRASVRRWLVTLARRRAVDRVRSEQPRRTAAEALVADRSFERSETPGHDEPFTEAWGADSAGIVRSLVARLPDAQREVLELAFFAGLSQSEVAERLGIPLGTVKTRTFRGMDRLRDWLAEAQIGAER